MKILLKIVLSNWINLLGVFLATEIYTIISALFDTNLSYNIFQATIASLFTVIGYGMIFWGIFIIALIVLDLFLIVPTKSNLKIKLIIEWGIISSPFIYWTIKYTEWVFIVAVLAFLLAQYLRRQYILKILAL